MQLQRELDFMQSVMKKCRLQLLRLDPAGEPDTAADHGLRQTLGLSHFYSERLWAALRAAKPRVLYRLRDEFSCRYGYFLLPEGSSPGAVLIGPYLDTELTHEQLLEQAERHCVPAHHFRILEKHYASLPVFLNEAPVFALMEAFCSAMWGDQYEVQELQDEMPHAIYSWENAAELEQAEWDLQAMEMRYNYENEILRAVAGGQHHSVELMAARFGALAFERRLPDELRNLKNYCIIMNTLLRKAVESAGVHPLYIDRLSSDFARRIEAVSSTGGIRPLMESMFSEYCRLVRVQSTGSYSKLVQSAMLYVGTHLADDLSLSAVAQKLDTGASYLSALFHKETGETFTAYVTRRRMQYARRLLQNTNLQIQTVAQHCGIYDVGYFSKLFRRHCGMPPKHYRSQSRLLPPETK